MKIIKIQKMLNNKYKIILDNTNIITFDNVILKYNLLYKKEITNDEFKKIVDESDFYDIYNKVLKFSTKKVRSTKEIEKYLNKFELTSSENNTILKKLKKINLINDEIYCKSFINDKIHLSKFGINKIRKMLENENIDKKLIEQEINKIDMKEINDNLEKKIIKKIDSNSKYSNYELKNKLLNYFINEGYNKEDIIEYLNEYKKNDNYILEKEFDKLYIKYKRKYNDNIFIIKLKQKLIQRGFDSESINILIQKKTEE